MSKVTVAAVQMKMSNNPVDNLDHAEALAREAAARSG